MSANTIGGKTIRVDHLEALLESTRCYFSMKCPLITTETTSFCLVLKHLLNQRALIQLKKMLLAAALLEG